MINHTSQLLFLIYEYLYNKGNRIERDYFQALDAHFSNMFSHQPEKYVRDYDLLNLIIKKSQFEHFLEIQSEMYDLLSLYRPGSINNPDNDTDC